MRVLMVTRNFMPDVGGMDTVFSEAYKQLAKNKEVENIEVITFHTPKRIPRKNVHEIFEINLPSFFLKTFLISARLKFDVIHANSYVSGIASVFPKIIFRKPLITSIYTSNPTNVESHFSFFGIIIRQFLNKFICKISDAIITGSDANRITLSKNLNIPKDRIFVGKYAADVKKYRFKTPVRKDDNFILLFVGGLYPEKGLHYLIESLKFIKNKKFVLWIVGYEIAKGYVDRLLKIAKDFGVEDKVKYLGVLDEREKLKVYAQSDIYIMPALVEGLNITCLEAASSGKPIVATKALESTESVTRENAIIVPPKNPKLLANAIIKLMDDWRLREKLGRNGRKYAEQFSWQSYSEDLVKIYKIFVKNQ